MKKILGILLPVAIAAAGVVFIISGAHSLATKDLYDSTVTATVVDIQEEWDTSDPENTSTVYTAYIDYEVDGVKYEHVESPEYKSGMSVGDTVDILYQSKDPSKISSQNITGTSVIFIAVGAVAVLAGGFVTVKKFIGSR